MKMAFHIRGLKANDALRRHLAEELQNLNALIPIAHADISLARQPDSTPPFQAVVVLALPGPDIHAAARDHTWPAAWLKVTERLREQIIRRRSGQQARAKARREFNSKTGRTRGLAWA